MEKLLDEMLGLFLYYRFEKGNMRASPLPTTEPRKFPGLVMQALTALSGRSLLSQRV